MKRKFLYWREIPMDLLRRAILWSISLAAVWAQQDPQFSLYMFNRQVLNPGFAGSFGSWNFTFGGRSQWVGIDGHPNTFTLTGHTYVPLIRGGVGGQVIGDYIGPFQTIDAKVYYAFHLPLGERGTKLQFGVAGGLLYKLLDGTNWRPPQTNNDPILVNAVTSATRPDVSAGIYLNGAEDRYYLGISGLHLIEPSFSALTQGGKGELRIVRHFNLMGGYQFRFSHTTSLTPSMLIKMAGSQLQYDLNMNFTVSPLIFGATYRWKDAIVGIVGFQISERLFAAYSYDYTLSGLAPATSGTHEIVISYTFPPVLKLYPPDLGVRDKKLLR